MIGLYFGKFVVGKFGVNDSDIMLLVLSVVRCVYIV